MQLCARLLLASLGIALMLVPGAAPTSYAQSRIAFHNQPVFLNGTNVAWVNFAGDLGPNPVDTNAFKAVFDSISAHGGNSLRLWLHTTGGSTPEFNVGGKVIGPGPVAIANLEKILDMAWQRRLGLMLTLWSFDMMRIANGALITNRSELMLTDTVYTHAYINNALIPMVNAVKGHPALLAWEVFNEPEGMTTEFGWSFNNQVSISYIQQFVNLVAGAIHRADPTAKVTNGTAGTNTLTDVGVLAKPVDAATRLSALSATEKKKLEDDFAAHYRARISAEEIVSHIAALPNKNYYRDDRLIQSGGDSLGTLDFYTFHYYDNHGAGTTDSPYHHLCSSLGLTKPVAVAEFFPEATLGVPYTALYRTLYDNGYAGALSWGWYSGADGHPQGILQANTSYLVQDLWDQHPQDIDPVPVAGKVYSFTIQPATIDSGQTSVVAWKTTLGTSATLNGSSVGINGTLTVSPATTTTYTLITSGTITDTTALTLTLYKSGKILAFRATPTLVGPGEPVTLRWTTSHGSVATLNGTSVSRIDSLVVRPDTTTTYRLIASGTTRDTLSVIVTVVPADQINRALSSNIVASSSSTTPALSNPLNAVDGNDTTQWESGASNNQNFNCDLGGIVVLKRVVIKWGANFATAYRIRISNDGLTFSTSRSTTNGVGGTEVVDSINQAARFVQLNLQLRSSSGSTGFDLREFQIYGLPQPLSVNAPGPQVPDRFALLQNYPNPFNPSTTINFAVPTRSQVTISIYNVIGQKVAEIANGTFEAGYHAIPWNATVASGVYFCRMQAVASDSPAQRFLGTTKLMLMK